MPYRYRAFAIDYDGTLAADDLPADDALAAVAEARDAGRHVLLVTGRIKEELLAVFPEVGVHFDAIVAENGCVLVDIDNGARALAPAVEPALARALADRGIPFRSGQVLFAMKIEHSQAVLEAIEQLGLELQLIRNRTELMIIPSGLNKGAGVLEALAELGVDRHNVVAIGDAENDHSLFTACEVGVAVGNAVDGLKAHAEIVLTQANGAAVAAFVRRVLRGDLALAQPERWKATLGEYADGTPVRVPAAAVGIGIYGDSGRGKSYLAGLLAERMIRLGYRVCVIDLEGDHTGLAELPGNVCIGGANPLPAIEDVVHLLVRGGASLVVDMSLHDVHVRASYARDLVEACQSAREEHGLPHCLIVDEAHVVFGTDDVLGPLAVDAAGLCLVTYRPDLLARRAHERLDYRITVHSLSEATIRSPDEAERGFTPADRFCRHSRHAQKYAGSLLPMHRRFLFRSHGMPTGRTAASLREFRDELATAADSVLIHHAAHGDFSRWLGDLCRDPGLAVATKRLEDVLAENAASGSVQRFRDELFAMLGDRYPL